MLYPFGNDMYRHYTLYHYTQAHKHIKKYFILFILFNET